MSFQDRPVYAGLVGKTISGLAVTKTGSMTLEVAMGSVGIQLTGFTHELGEVQSHTFQSDPSREVVATMNLISNGVNVDLWVDAYVDDGQTTQADVPSGFEHLLELAWFRIPPGEVNLDNTVLNRRTWL